MSWWSRSALAAIVLLLGLVQGSRAALGELPFADAAEPALAAPAEAPAGGVIEPAARGRFFRPEGSNAVPPALRLQQSVWTPPEAERIALSCPGC